MKTMTRPTAAAIWILLGLAFLSGQSGHGRDGKPEHADAKSLAARFRQPAALALVDGDSRLLVANRQSGSISAIDTRTRQVLAEHDVGRGLADIVALPDGRHLLAVDQAGNDILVLDWHANAIQVLARVQVSPDPVRIVVSSDGSSCVAASRWSRRLTFLELTRGRSPEDEPSLKIIQALDLPFCPQNLLASRDGSKLVVADAFGGKLALVDLQRRSLESVRSLPAHNIRGLALAADGKTLVVAHEVLNPLARSTFDDLHWGLLISNHLRVLRLDVVLKPDADLLRGSGLFELGDVGKGAGDPSGLEVDSRGNLIVALGGVNEAAITHGPGQPLRRVAVGHRPGAMAVGRDGKVVYIANGLDDTVSVVEIDSGRNLAAIALGPSPEMSLADRGERLFFDARLSHDGWMSCHSCHTDGHTCGLKSDTLGDGSYGASKKIPSLLGVGATGPWTWTGSMERLEDQVRSSIQTTMHGPKPAPTAEQVEALSAYLRSLRPLSPALTDGEPATNEALMRGRDVFQSRRCDACHKPPEYTSLARFDVGLADEVGNRQFNPPSLRGVSRREPLLHDGRASTLEDLFQRHRHPRESFLSLKEIRDLVAFLRTL
jgi:YVTN family beta-propeller protein